MIKKPPTWPKRISIYGKVNQRFWDRLDREFPGWDSSKYFLTIPGDAISKIDIDRNFWMDRVHSIPIAPERAKEFDIIDPNEIVTTRRSVTIQYVYPLSKEVNLTYKNKQGFTRALLFKCIQRGYLSIYDAYGGHKKYGIWGHGIKDLVLEGVHINSRGRIFLQIGS